VVEIRRYRCPGCKALWQVLPRFIARMLWRSWGTVEAVLSGAATVVPARTRRRWRARARSSGRTLQSVLATSGHDKLCSVAERLGLSPSRREVLSALGGLSALSWLAALIHRLMPDIRVL